MEFSKDFLVGKFGVSIYEDPLLYNYQDHQQKLPRIGNGFVWTVSVIAGYNKRCVAVGDIEFGYELVSL